MIPKSMLDEINRWIDQKKFGNLQINFSGGKIINFNRNESVRLEIVFKDQIGNITSSATISESKLNVDSSC